jgi:hypothetical protein
MRNHSGNDNRGHRTGWQKKMSQTGKKGIIWFGIFARFKPLDFPLNL